jgi:hypothetical protein
MWIQLDDEYELELRIMIDDETLKEYLQYRVITGYPLHDSKISWKTVKKVMGSKPEDFEEPKYEKYQNYEP